MPASRCIGRPQSREYRVALVLPEGSGLDVTVEAATPGLAVNAAERMHRGARATALTLKSAILGRCRRCKAVVLEGDGAAVSPAGVVTCIDCG